MDLIKARNMTSHTHSTAIAQEISADILDRFHTAFEALAATFSAFSQGDNKKVDMPSGRA